MSDETKVQTPASAISATGDDIAVPAKALYISLRLMGTDEDQEKADKACAFSTGPTQTQTQSVAGIEASATALTKWWAAGLGVAATAFWGPVKAFWTDQPPETHRTMLASGEEPGWIALTAERAGAGRQRVVSCSRARHRDCMDPRREEQSHASRDRRARS